MLIMASPFFETWADGSLPRLPVKSFGGWNCRTGSACASAPPATSSKPKSAHSVTRWIQRFIVPPKPITYASFILRARFLHHVATTHWLCRIGRRRVARTEVVKQQKGAVVRQRHAIWNPLSPRSQPAHPAAARAAAGAGGQSLVQLGPADALAFRAAQPGAVGRGQPQPQGAAQAHRRAAPARSRRGPGVPRQLLARAAGVR